MFEYAAQERKQQLEAGQAALNDWQRLYSWAQEQEPGAVLGQSCTNSLDPLGAYLGAATQTRPEVWSVGPSIKTGYGDRLVKPNWVKSLIEETDRATGNQSGPVTREAYLAVLERVKPGSSAAEVYNREIDERNRIVRENIDKPWLPLHDGE